MAPIFHALPPGTCVTVLTGQHYDDQMVANFFEDLDLPAPGFRVSSTRGAYGLRLGDMVEGVASYLRAHPVEIVLVEGDTDSVLAGALAAANVGIPVGHVEAGLRCGDRAMPEERNRVALAHLADLHFCPTVLQRQNLLAEGVDPGRIFVVGNTVVDALRHVGAFTMAQTREIVTLTVHRDETLADPAGLARILAFARSISADHHLPAVFPVHPHTRKVLDGLDGAAAGLELLDPLGYRAFIGLLRRSALVLTDSGGVQEETTCLGIPCVTLRRTTERPETVFARTNLLLPPGLLGTWLARHTVCRLLQAPWTDGTAETILGDGHAGRRIAEILAARFGG